MNSSYSAQSSYSRPDGRGRRYMFMCRVLTGDYTTGSEGLTVAPSKGGSALYDSVVDNVRSPSMFVIFKDNQAYPEYLISFK